MRIITGSLSASAGTAKVAGYDVVDYPLEVKRRIGYLPENPPLYDEMTVRGYLDFVATLKRIPPKQRKASCQFAVAGELDKDLVHHYVADRPALGKWILDGMYR